MRSLLRLLRVRSAAKILKSARNVLVFTGAGISASTGIPTFRDVGGLWTDEDIAFFGSPEAWQVDPWRCWAAYESFRLSFSHVAPTRSHWALAALADVVSTSLFTSNVDSLHEKTGTPVSTVHGVLRQAKCTACGGVVVLPKSSSIHPGCPSCGSWLRHDVVLWGEPTRNFDELQKEIERADVILIVGASGEVTDIEEISRTARGMGKKIIEINPKKSPATKYANVYFDCSADEILPRIVSLI